MEEGAAMIDMPKTSKKMPTSPVKVENNRPQSNEDIRNKLIEKLSGISGG